nr:MAG TPA: hypothetical protein [Bacteriophage sp.]
MCIKDYSPETYHILSKPLCKHQSSTLSSLTNTGIIK